MTTPNELVPMILPTVMIPLTLVSVGISVVASFIAGLFGIQLQMEGPKKLLEVLLKPKVLASALLLNAIVLGGLWSWKWWKNYPKLISTIEKQTEKNAQTSNHHYEDHPTVLTLFTSMKSEAQVPQQLEQVWRLQTGAGSFRAAAISSGRVFTGNDNGIVSEVDLRTGKVIRTFYIGTAVSAEITLWQNSLYLGEGVHDTHHARVYRFDLKTGKLLGSYQTLGHTEGQAVIGQSGDKHLLFVVAGTDGLHAVDPLTMEGKWKVNLGHMDAGILVHEGTVYIGTGREKDDDKKNKCFAAALNFDTGKIIWKHELPASSWMRPVVAGENICYISGEIYFPTERGHIACFDRKSGEHTLALNTPDPLAGTPKVLDQSILYTSIHGLVCRFDLKAQRNQWCFNAQMKDFSLAGASYDPRVHVVLYPSITNGLYVLDPDSGKVLMHWKPEKAQGEWKKTYADVTVGGDYWIVADDDGSVRGLKPQFASKLADGK
jgi:outer membrane protein assembly factor BamB